MLIREYSKFNGARLYNLRSIVNIHNLKTDFNRLTLVKDWHLRQHDLKLEYKNKRFLRVPNQHGFPEFKPIHHASIQKILDTFVFLHDCDEEKSLHVEFQRITCSDEVVGLPETSHWHTHPSGSMGIICIDRENIRGGIHEIKNHDHEHLRLEVEPGFMILYDSHMQQRETPMTPFYQLENCHGHRDLIRIHSTPL